MEEIIELCQVNDSQNGIVCDVGGVQQILPEQEQSVASLRVMCDLGVGGQRGRVFSPNGVCPTLSGTDYKDPIKILSCR